MHVTKSIQFAAFCYIKSAWAGWRKLTFCFPPLPLPQRAFRIRNERRIKEGWGENTETVERKEGRSRCEPQHKEEGAGAEAVDGPPKVGGKRLLTSMEIAWKILQAWTWTRAPHVLILGLKIS